MTLKRLEGGINVKTYKLSAVVEGENIVFNKNFKTRTDALDYIFTYYDKHHLQSLYIDEEYYVNENKHDIEYVCDYSNRFRVTRCMA